MAFPFVATGIALNDIEATNARQVHQNIDNSESGAIAADFGGSKLHRIDIGVRDVLGGVGRLLLGGFAAECLREALQVLRRRLRHDVDVLRGRCRALDSCADASDQQVRDVSFSEKPEVTNQLKLSRHGDASVFEWSYRREEVRFGLDLAQAVMDRHGENHLRGRSALRVGRRSELPRRGTFGRGLKVRGDGIHRLDAMPTSS